MALIVSVPLANQLQVPFIHIRSIYEIRERPSHMYSWTALVTSQILAELPWNMLGSTVSLIPISPVSVHLLTRLQIFFFCWYWTVGFASSRAGFTYLLIGICLPIYYTTIGQAIAAMSPNAEIAALLFSFLFSFVLTFNGVLQPFRALGWWQWM
jgi:ATP-binding cassette subfamily G (WHITE) protein 2 (SNQ2)